MNRICLPLLSLVVLFFASCKTDKREPILSSPANLPIQQFVISADSIGVVKGKQGSSYLFPAGCLADSNGQSVKGPVEITLIEVNRIEDFIKSGITTESNGELLISDGSYFLEARQNGNLLTVQKGKQVYARFSTKEKDPDMGFFTGANTDRNVNWMEAKDQKQLSAKLPQELSSKKYPVKNKIKEPVVMTTTPAERSVLMAEYNDISMYLYDNIYNDETHYVELGGWYIPEAEAERIVNSKYGISYSEYKPFNNYGTKGKSQEIQRIVDQETRATPFRYRASIVKAREKRFKELNKLLGIAQPTTPTSFKRETKIKRQEDERWESFIHREDEAYKKEFGTQAYLYALGKLGWVNCDKFSKANVVSYSGRILAKDGDPIAYATEVHLISRKEKIHLKQLVIDGNYSFRYPDDRPFDIVFVYGPEEITKTFEGSRNLEDIRLSAAE